MATVDERNSNGYWGLTIQNGPWKQTPRDIRNLKRSGPVLGGGLGAGGTQHAGHGNYLNLINPYQQNGRKPPPMPSKYASRNVIVKAPDVNLPKQRAGVFKQMIGRPVVVNVGLGEKGRQDFQQGGQQPGGNIREEPTADVDHVKEEHGGNLDDRMDIEFEKPKSLHSGGHVKEEYVEPSLLQSSFSTEHQLLQDVHQEISRGDYLPSPASSYMSRDYPSLPSMSPRSAVNYKELESLPRPDKYVERGNFLNLVYPGSEPAVETYKPPRTTLTIDTSLVDRVTKEENEKITKEDYTERKPKRKSKERELDEAEYEPKKKRKARKTKFETHSRELRKRTKKVEIKDEERK